MESALASEDQDEADVHVCNLCTAAVRGLDAYIQHRRAESGQCPALSDGGRLRRASAEQAAVFMESLGLSKTKEGPEDHQPEAAKRQRNKSQNGKDALLLWPLSEEDAQEPALRSPRHNGRPSLLSFNRHALKQSSPVVAEGLLSLDLSLPPSQTDFMRHFQLMNVSSVGVDDADVEQPVKEDGRWKLWQPEREDEALWSDVVLGEHVDQHEEAVEEPLSKRKRTLSKRYSPEPTTRRKRRPSPSSSFVTCPTCDSRTPRHQFAKHLISHYHHYHSRVPPTDTAFTKLVLDHVHDVVRLCPFQCQECAFYCNGQEDFIQHWREAHGQQILDGGEAFWCSFCSFRTPSGATMKEHLDGERHRDISAALGRVVPIVIRRLKLQQCSLCENKFRLKMALNRHLTSAHHQHSECKHCRAHVTGGAKALRDHVFSAHPEKRALFHCFSCKMEFRSSNEREKHGKSRRHKAVIKACRESSRWPCDKCGTQFDGLSGLKDHMRGHHGRDLSACGSCGHTFALPQELGAHVRTGCEANVATVTGSIACSEASCQFRCNSINQLLYHESLRHHQRSQTGFECKVCRKKLSSRAKLWSHVRIHGNCHRCKLCYRIFGSKTGLASHLEKSHADQNEERTHYCGLCSYAASNKRLLAAHMRRTHFKAEPCPHCGQALATYKQALAHAKIHKAAVYSGQHACAKCAYVAGNKWDLKSHMTTHEEARSKDFHCLQCQFKCARRSELLRHVKRAHEASVTSFKCSECGKVSATRQHHLRHQATHAHSGRVRCRLCRKAFTSLESLRKHILKTDAHAGRSVYECDFCDFAADSAVQFRGHVLSQHAGGALKDQSEAKEYVANYFNCDSTKENIP